ncbi:hypothetical protein GCM10007377_16100 [Galliscardovia ingluviei]|uniref:Peptidase C51 domain-containing protein n=1 Tax=Galliscardovia ingluviei TaxID=1769422 RepID=A0A8J3AJA5_9BIFI|nr:CHAP domain-containing protein [Galliscardovia ingluviei]GGI15478.1 hypothetical protein GCM10007377_16100 [Galliscardovia ingluviei]
MDKNWKNVGIAAGLAGVMLLPVLMLGQAADVVGAGISAATVSQSGGNTGFSWWRNHRKCRQNDANATTGSVIAVADGKGKNPYHGKTWGEITSMVTEKTGDAGACSSYDVGQCTWWACMRYRLAGITVDPYMGNGQDWVNSAVNKLGWEKDKLVVGSVISNRAGARVGSWNADPKYGHVMVVESIDEATKTVIASSGGAGYGGVISTETFHYDPLPEGTTVAAPTANAKNAISVTGTQDTGTVCDMTDSSGDTTPIADNLTVGDGYHATAEKAKEIARALLPKVFPGATEQDWKDLEWLWTKESSWRWDADNPSSDAYGIPQSLPGDKMAAYGADWHDNAATQITWGLHYIQERYGSIANARSFWENHHWY